MPKKVADKEAPQTVACSICHESVPLNEYASHIQTKHSTPPPAAAPPAQGPPRAQIPSSPIPWAPPFPSVAGPGAFSPGAGPMGGGPRSMTGPINANEYAGTPYLKGTDLPSGVNQVKARILEWVYIPGQRSPLACRIEKLYEKEFLGVNKTNIKQLLGFGFPDLSVLVNRTLVLGTYPVNNPSTGQMTKGLWIMGVE